jgi:hypothetical protein
MSVGIEPLSRGEREMLEQIFADERIVAALERVCALEAAQDLDRMVDNVNSIASTPNVFEQIRLGSRVGVWRELVAMLRAHLERRVEPATEETT